RAVRWLRRGHAPIAFAGGCESIIDPVGIWMLNSMRALTTQCDIPEIASRPFDRNRSGFVLSEAGAVLVLETLEHALRRDAPILCEVIGVGGSANAYSLYAPEPVGIGPAGAMDAALRDARIDYHEVDLVIAHATATDVGDPAEAEGIKLSFKDHASTLAVTG